MTNSPRTSPTRTSGDHDDRRPLRSSNPDQRPGRVTVAPGRERKPKPPVTPQRAAELDRKRRHSAMIRASTRIAIAWVLLTGLYFVIPFDGLDRGDGFLRLASSLAVFALAALWELRQIE